MKKSILLVLFSLFISAVFGQGQALTLQECVKIALDNNLQVKRSVFNVESYEWNLWQAKGAYLPSLTAQGSLGRNYGRNLNPVTYTYYQGVTSTVNPLLSANLTLFNGFRIQNNFFANKKAYIASNLDLEKAKNDVILNVVTYYTNVILNQELFENAKFQLSSSQQTLERIKKQVEAGALPKSNELNQEAIVASNETNLINQENTLNYSMLQLKQSMQLPASNQFQVVIPDISMDQLTIDSTPEKIYDMSLQALPQVKSALLKVESADFALRSLKGTYYPRLSLSASASSNYSSASDVAQKTITGFVPGGPGVTNPVATDVNGNLLYSLKPTFNTTSDHYGTQDQLNNNIYKTLSLNLTVPILNGLQTRNNVKQAIITKELADITVKETQNTLRQSIETAFNNAVAAAKTYVASLKQVNASDEALRMTKQRFDNGAANFVEYQISVNDLFSAKSSLSRAKFNFLLTTKILDFYQGKPMEY